MNTRIKCWVLEISNWVQAGMDHQSESRNLEKLVARKNGKPDGHTIYTLHADVPILSALCNRPAGPGVHPRSSGFCLVPLPWQIFCLWPWSRPRPRPYRHYPQPPLTPEGGQDLFMFGRIKIAGMLAQPLLPPPPLFLFRSLCFRMK